MKRLAMVCAVVLAATGCDSTAPVPVASVSVSPGTATVAVGSTQQLTATMQSAGGSVLTGRAATWTSSATSVATVTSSGLVTGIAPGTATITATSEGKSGSATVTTLGASVVITAASASIVVRGNYNYDQVTLTLQNNGGPGSYYLELWSYPWGGRPTVWQSPTVTVLAGYTETLVFDALDPGKFTEAVKVKSQPVNTAVYTQTDCRVVRTPSTTWCP